MIARLAGKLVYKADYIILDANGVGYEIFMSAFSLKDLPDLNNNIVVRIYTHVREDALQLFGFIQEEEYKVFKTIISINGFGPRLALQILSYISPHEFVAAIISEDKDRLRQVKGLGEKKAATLILELKNKLESFACMIYDRTAFSELRSALQNLGFDIKEINKAINELQKNVLWKDSSLSELLPQALKILTGKQRLS